LDLKNLKKFPSKSEITNTVPKVKRENLPAELSRRVTLTNSKTQIDKNTFFYEVN
tara:strand:- start:272 stop:436 length:165 start_codon:yes stop_codon:yes gene_type:complete